MCGCVWVSICSVVGHNLKFLSGLTLVKSYLWFHTHPHRTLHTCQHTHTDAHTRTHTPTHRLCERQCLSHAVVAGTISEVSLIVLKYALLCSLLSLRFLPPQIPVLWLSISPLSPSTDLSPLSLSISPLFFGRTRTHQDS